MAEPWIPAACSRCGQRWRCTYECVHPPLLPRVLRVVPFSVLAAIVFAGTVVVALIVGALV